MWMMHNILTSLTSLNKVHAGDAVFCVPEPTVDPSIADCDFENGLCLYHQETAETKVWNRVSVKPNAYRIGDHTTGSGELHCTTDCKTCINAT